MAPLDNGSIKTRVENIRRFKVYNFSTAELPHISVHMSNTSADHFSQAFYYSRWTIRLVTVTNTLCTLCIFFNLIFFKWLAYGTLATSKFRQQDTLKIRLICLRKCDTPCSIDVTCVSMCLIRTLSISYNFINRKCETYDER